VPAENLLGGENHSFKRWIKVLLPRQVDEPAGERQLAAAQPGYGRLCPWSGGARDATMKS
jgi:hypothetical protein